MQFDNVKAVYEYSEAGLAAGKVPSELEFELVREHGTDRELVDEVMPLIRVLYDAKEHREMEYFSWLDRVFKPSRAPVLEGIMTVLMIPITLWIGYRLGLLVPEIFLIEPLTLVWALLVLAISLPIAAALGVPMFWFSRWSLNRRADWVRNVRAPRLLARSGSGDRRWMHS